MFSIAYERLAWLCRGGQASLSSQPHSAFATRERYICKLLGAFLPSHLLVQWFWETSHYGGSSLLIMWYIKCSCESPSPSKLLPSNILNIFITRAWFLHLGGFSFSWLVSFSVLNELVWMCIDSSVPPGYHLGHCHVIAALPSESENILIRWNFSYPILPRMWAATHTKWAHL